MLQTLMCRQRVLSAIPTVTEFADVQRVGLFVFVLEVTLQGVIAREGSTTVRTLLGLVDAAAGWWWHPELTTVVNADAAAATIRRGGRRR